MNDTAKGKSVNITVLTVSDTRTDQNDKSGDTLVKRLTEAGHHLVEKRIVKDELSLLKDVLKEWINSSEVDVIIATGGTGVTGRDVTPEAFESLYEKSIPGFRGVVSMAELPKYQDFYHAVSSHCGCCKWNIPVCLTRFHRCM